MQGLCTTREVFGARQRHRPPPCAPCPAIRVRSLATVRQTLGTHCATTAVGYHAPTVLPSFHVGLGEEKYESPTPAPLVECASKIIEEVTPEIFDVLILRGFTLDARRDGNLRYLFIALPKDPAERETHTARCFRVRPSILVDRQRDHVAPPFISF